MRNGTVSILNNATILQIQFEFADDLDPVFTDRDHKEFLSFISGSLLSPPLDPNLIRSMNATQNQVTNPDVLEDLIALSSAD